MDKNNPVSVADNERRFIWPDKSTHLRDIIISVGTGYSSDVNGREEKYDPLSKFLEPFRRFGVISKIIMLRGVVYNTLSCQKQWKEFEHSVGPDAEALKRCHRINVPFGPEQTLCGIDEASKVPEMKQAAFNFLEGRSQFISSEAQRNTFARIGLIARQLVACLFYFEVSSVESSGSNQDIKCSGTIICRLGRSYRTQFWSMVDMGPLFQVFADGSNVSYDHVRFESTGWNERDFSIAVSFSAPRNCREIALAASFDAGENWDCISGFPRSLQE